MIDFGHSKFETDMLLRKMKRNRERTGRARL
jgi:hypothetical protein